MTRVFNAVASSPDVVSVLPLLANAALSLAAGCDVPDGAMSGGAPGSEMAAQCVAVLVAKLSPKQRKVSYETSSPVGQAIMTEVMPTGRFVT